ncbi:MAG: hypothetical protein LBV43_12555 [Prevotella sp.]|jgi:hypothetical protein|nr:hypothetical protein [Prevotella sp.]
MDELSLVLVTGILTYGIYKLFELFARRKERMAMIEKLSTGIDPQILQYQLNPIKIPVYKKMLNDSWAIRIGLLLVGVGLGVIIATSIDLAISLYEGTRELYYEYKRTIDVLYPSCAAVFGGIGLVAAYIIEKKDEKKGSSKLEE